MLVFTFPDTPDALDHAGEAWRGHPSWELVGTASAIAGVDLDAMLATEPGPRTEVERSLATFVLGLVALDAAERLGLEPTSVTGFSLGEYTSLAAAGAIGLEDAIGLVVERGHVLDAVAASTDCATAEVCGLDDVDVDVACIRAEGDVHVAAYCAPGRVRIAGAHEALGRAIAFARADGATEVLGPTDGAPLHTPLVASSRERLRKAIGVVSCFDADPVVVANADARPHARAHEWPGLLTSQHCAPVRWRQGVKGLFADGARTFVELGPGSTLTDWTRATLSSRDVQATSIASPLDLEALMESFIGHAADSRPVEHYPMAERLLVAPAAGPFHPAAGLAQSAPTLTASDEAAPDAGRGVHVAVGDLVGWAGPCEIRAGFSGILGGILVLEGERVMPGQPVAWIRAADDT